MSKILLGKASYYSWKVKIRIELNALRLALRDEMSGEMGMLLVICYSLIVIRVSSENSSSESKMQGNQM
jgi:hypothetical protein